MDDPLLRHFEEYLVRSALSPTTVVNYLADLRAFARWFAERHGEGVSLTLLTSEDVRAYCRYLLDEEKRAPSTINRRLQAVRKFCRFAVENGLMAENPAAEVALLRETTPPLPTLSQAEVAALLEAARRRRGSTAPRDYAIIRLLLDTGLRVGELVDLRLDDVDLELGFVMVGQSAADGGRFISLSQETCDALRDYLQVRPFVPAVDHLFLSREGNPISIRTVQRLIRLYGQLAGLEGVSAHTLRNTFAQTLWQNTRDVTTLAQALGHRSLNTTARYVTAFENE